MKLKQLFASAVLSLLSLVSQAQTTPVTIYYHNDLLGSPLAATNAQGQVIWRENYRPYGERTKNEADAQKERIFFTARHQDPDTGLIYMGARYYDPTIGRFLSTDPVRFRKENIHSFNRYAYANNNPYKYTDPDGRAAQVAVLPAMAGYKLATALGAVTVGGIIGRGLWNILHSDSANDGEEKKPEESKPSLVDPERAAHILDGDRTGGGHRAGTGKKGKSEFPADWSDEKILGEISDVATDPGSARAPGRGKKELVRGTRDGVDVEVVVHPDRGIVSGYPTNRPRNP